MRAGLALVEAVAALPAPDSVLIASTTRRLVGAICPRPGRIAEAQGWPSPLPVWRVTGENPSAARFDAAHGNLPLINRMTELQQLCASLYRTRRNLRSPSLKVHVAAAWNE